MASNDITLNIPIDGGILALDLDLSIIKSNTVFNILFGYSSSKDSKVCFLDFLDSTSKTVFKKSLDYDMSIVTVDAIMKDISGSVYHHVLIKVVKNKDYYVLGIMLQNEMQDYVKSLKRERSKFSSVLNLTNSLIVEFSTDGSLIFYTDSFASLCGLDSHKKYNILTDSFIHNEDLDSFSSICVGSECSCKLIELRLKVGTIYEWFSLSYVYSYDDISGDISSVTGLLTNIHSYKCKLENLAHEADTDCLTGCFNKGYLQKMLLGTSLPSSSYLLFFDIDYFKGINDTYGHILGDYALKSVGDICKEVFNDNSIVCRFGGDEYCIWTTGTSKHELKSSLDILMSKVRQIKLNSDTPITLSIGISEVSSQAKDLSKLMEFADVALYRVKQAGKDNYMFYSDLELN